MRFHSRRPPPNYLGRSEQRRLLTIVILLGAVLLLMRQAGKPDNWRWFMALSNPPAAAEQALPAAANKPAARAQSEPDAVPLQAGKEPRPGEEHSGSVRPELLITVRDVGARLFASARDLLQSAGVEENDFHRLVDGQSLGSGEQQSVLRVLQAIRKCPLNEIEHLARDRFDPDQVREASNANRGEIFHLHGEVIRVTIEKLPSEVVDRYDIKQYYRCRVVLEPGAESATIIVLAIPKAWPLEKEFSERISCLGVYLKLTPGEVENVPEPVFAAQRLAWHCDGVLGDLGMDVGLFDDVENKTSIAAAERECFYELLAAAGKANPQELFHLTDRPPNDDYSVVPLFNEPGKQHGRLVAFTGTARRAILVKLDPKTEADAIRRLGIDHYYQVDIFTADSQGNPLVFCVRDLPAGMPEGPQIDELVRIPGFFFKSWAYRPQSFDEKQAFGYQLAPMLIGSQLRWLQIDSGRSSIGQAIAGGLFAVILVGLFVGIWLTNRGDRKFRQRILGKQS